jgi:hypothetical protein
LDWKVKQRLFFSGLLFFVFGKKRRYEMGKETKKKVALQITLESASRLLSRFFFIVEHHHP